MATPLNPLTRFALPGLALLASCLASAADNSATSAAALKVLTQTGPETRASAPSAPERETLTVQKSETLDMLVRRHYASWPFKDEVLRRALAELNPKVLPNAANNLLKRGSTLQLPNTDDLRRTLLQHYPNTAELVRVKVEREVEEGAMRSAQAGADGPDKRRWVRFP